jgi:lysine 2,3-aminomutase
MSELRGRLSGLALPTYVLDLPGAHGKVPLETYATVESSGRTRLRDVRNHEHVYDDCCSAPDVP